MAEETTGGTSAESTGTESGAGSVETPNENTQDGAGATGAASDGSQPDGQSAEGDEGDQEFVKDDDGNEYIPRKAFEARIAKLAAQKNDAKSAFLEAVRNDPAVKKEFMDILKGEESAAASEQSDEPTPFEAFLSPLPPEHQAHYRNMGKALAAEFETFVQSSIEEAMAPVKSWIGQTKVESFEKTNKDFPKYRKQVADIMSAGRAKNIDDAYILASYHDRMKGASSVGAKQEQERREKMARIPSAGRNIQGSQTTQKGPKGLKAVLARVGPELGYTE
jgi:hypothetical protein